MSINRLMVMVIVMGVEVVGVVVTGVMVAIGSGNGEVG